MDDYFDIEIDDNSHIDIASWIYNYYVELMDNKTDYLIKLKKNLIKFQELYKFSIEFPIISKSKKLQQENDKKNTNKIEIKSDLQSVELLNNKIDKMEIDDEGFMEVKKKGKKC